MKKNTNDDGKKTRAVVEVFNQNRRDKYKGTMKDPFILERY